MRYLFVFVYFFVMLLIGIISVFKVKTDDDFFVGGRKSGTWLITGSLTATILGSSAVLGTSNMAYNMGFSAMWWLLCAFSGLLILYPLAGLVRRYGNYSFPELIGSFYGRQAFYISSVIIPVAWTGVVSAQITGSAKVLNSFLSLDYSIAVLISGFVFMAYTLAGGQVAILKTDILQSGLIITGILYLFLFVMFSGEGEVFSEIPASFPFSEGFGWFELIVLFLTLSTTYFVGPDIYSRLFCAKNEKTARRSVIFTSFIILIFSFVIVYLGVYARNILNADTKSQTVLVELSFHMLPGWAIGLMTAALLSAIMSSADTTLLTASTIISEIFCINKRERFRPLTRIFIVVTGILSILFSLYVRNIISSLLTAFTIFSGSFIIPALAGLIGYRTSKWKVNTAIIAGGATALAGKVILLSGMDFNGNIIIISAFFINALFLFWPAGKINKIKQKS